MVLEITGINPGYSDIFQIQDQSRIKRVLKTCTGSAISILVKNRVNAGD